MPYLDCGRCNCQEVDGYPLLFLLADVNANGMWQMFLPLQCIETIDWLMLLPSGRLNSHMLLVCYQCYMGRCYCPVADGMATICILCDGRCYCPVADGMATVGCECFHPGRCCSQGADGYG